LLIVHHSRILKPNLVFIWFMLMKALRAFSRS
jgi:hypothetical protein